MAEQQTHDDDAPVPRVDGHRASEFIYGTVTGMVAVAGIDVGRGASWLGAAAIIIVGAAAIWIAHAYSTLLGRRIADGRRLEARDLGEALAGSWPIVVAGMVLAVPLIATALGAWSLDTALWASSFVGVAILALVGILAGVVTRETWLRRVLLAVGSAGLGLIVVAVEVAVHH
jgi:hypothetical protein